MDVKAEIDLLKMRLHRRNIRKQEKDQRDCK